ARFVASIACAALLAACGRESSSPVAQLPAASGLRPAGIGADSSKPRLYTVNNGANSLTAYRVEANGNVAPRATIAGSSTQLNTPINMTISAKGRIVVTNLGSNTVTEYPAGANGNASPVATISCGGLDLPDGVAVDKAGNIYVANLNGNSISIFKRKANGCVAKTRQITGSNTQLLRPAGLMIAGSTLFVGNIDGHSITEYPSSSRGNVAPTAEISGGSTMLVNPVGFAVDGSGNLYVADDSAQAVIVFAAGANG